MGGWTCGCESVYPTARRSGAVLHPSCTLAHGVGSLAAFQPSLAHTVPSSRSSAYSRPPPAASSSVCALTARHNPLVISINMNANTRGNITRYYRPPLLKPPWLDGLLAANAWPQRNPCRTNVYTARRVPRIAGVYSYNDRCADGQWY